MHCKIVDFQKHSLDYQHYGPHIYPKSTPCGAWEIGEVKIKQKLRPNGPSNNTRQIIHQPSFQLVGQIGLEDGPKNSDKVLQCVAIGKGRKDSSLT